MYRAVVIKNKRIYYGNIIISLETVIKVATVRNRGARPIINCTPKPATSCSDAIRVSGIDSRGLILMTVAMI